ncbi:MAG: 5-(carboxyamino)imidazole ribonucleotide mutase [Acidobacteriota bacterium]|nr:5-(carboxyamino)imidazole ribonucleotide mutase [Acidobacteriota bacterium]
MGRRLRAAILMGSASDLEVMSRAAKELDRFSVGYRVEVTSAHRSPDRTVELVRSLEAEGAQVFIVGAGMAAHLAGVVAAHTTRPVLGVPIGGSALDGLDSLFSTVQMPRGVPVATLAVGSHGASNAGILTCQILALTDAELRARLEADRREMARKVEQDADEARTRLSKLLDERS